MVDFRAHNRESWNRRAAAGDQWSQPVSAEVIAAARQNHWHIILTPTKPIPHSWFPPLAGCRVLCLASGGGQQGPVLAAAGATVTVLDFSPQQLAHDRFVAERDGLSLTTIEGDMTDLSPFADDSFDLIVHPVANTYVPNIRPVWAEAYRVLQPGGALLSGFINPANFIFDDIQPGPPPQARFTLPYSELTSLNDTERQQLMAEGYALQFSHTLTEQIAGQLDAGFLITGFYEDSQPTHPLSAYMPTHMATRALKPIQ